MKGPDCKYCSEPFDRHGNALYCSKECYMEAKKERNRILYAERKRYDPILKNDRILAWFHQQGHDVVSLETLHRRGFDETYYLKRAKDDRKTVLITGVFGISSHSDNQLQIHNFTNGGD